MISKKTKYAFSALVFLAQRGHQKPVLIQEIAAGRNIPRKFLEGILLDLKNHGILGSRRGKGGGYYLLKNPAEVHLAEVLRIFEGAIGLVPCVTHRYYEPCEDCPDEELCGIRHAFREVRDSSVEILKGKNLAVLLESEVKGAAD